MTDHIDAMSSWNTLVAPLIDAVDAPARPATIGKARSAFDLAESIYRGHEHWSGVSLLEHVVGVLRLLMPFAPDEDTMAACLLHHALDLDAMSLTDIEERFGTRVRSLVSGVHLLSHVTMRNRRGSIDDLRLMLVSVSDDIRVILIILCDRVDALEHADHLTVSDRKRVCSDVLGLFAPVAARLGIHTLKQRLETLAFPVIYPSDAEAIAEQKRMLQERYGSFLETAAGLLAKELQSQGIHAVVEGREKLSYSIFLKMKAKSLSHIEKMQDLYALRVFVDTEEECYRTLGYLHRMGRPVPNRFKDYIAFPKPNGYRSLHTTIARLPGVPDSVFVEVQVRTHAMHREAEYGIAAHWSYKEGGGSEHAMQRIQLQQMLLSQQPLEHADRDAPSLVDHIFVLTPKGDIVELPEGATPLDFAFQIHTHLGLSFRAARVNGSIVPLEYALENGDVVEVMSYRIPKPSPDWMQRLKMASSRSRLRSYLYSLDRDLYVARGKEMINEELQKHRQPALDSDLSALRLYDDRVLPMEEREDILMKIGQGSERAASLLDHLSTIPLGVASKSRVRISRVGRAHWTVEVDGGVPMPLRHAKCCKPEAGDPKNIVGFITRTGEVTVHRENCRMLKTANPERKVGVRWREVVKK